MNKNIASTVHKNANGANNWLKFTNSLPPPDCKLSKSIIQVNFKSTTCIHDFGREFSGWPNIYVCYIKITQNEI